MIGSITGAYSYYNPYALYRAQNVQRPQSVQTPETADASRNAGRAQSAGGTWTAQRAASPETPVQPVQAVAAAAPDRAQSALLGLPAQGAVTGPQGGSTTGPAVLRTLGADPAEMAVRMRIRPYDESSSQYLPAQGTAKEDAGAAIGPQNGPTAAQEIPSAQEVMEEGQCETCEKRKYQDGSDDMGVSFQTPTRIDPDMVASAVRGHENEHVVREQAKAEREDRKVVSQSVTLHTDICPECGKVYISGGETRTVTAAKNDAQEQQNAQDKADEERTPFSVWG